MMPLSTSRRAIDVIVPFYRRPDLVSPLFASIHRLREELRDLDCSIVVVNDSPEDRVLKDELARESRSLAGILPCTILENEVNVGFVGSSNRALRETIGRRHDAILLNSDTVMFLGAVSELRRVAYLDPAIGFVSPRSNNATLCSLPHQQEYNSLSAEESFARFSSLAARLPEYHYVPTGVGFCLYIKWPLLDQVGVFDEIYSPGYNEENDLIMRARGRGYRVALANRAYVYHAGSASFSSSATAGNDLDKRNALILSERYPHFLKQVDQYYRSDHLRAELLLPGLFADATGRRDLLLDLSALAPRDEPMSKAIRGLVMDVVEQSSEWFNIFLAGPRDSIEFHRLHELPGVPLVDQESSRICAVALCFGLPRECEQVVRLSRLAVCNVYALPDSIATGAAPLELKLADELRDFVYQHADGVIYETGLARDQFLAFYECHPAAKAYVADLRGVHDLDYGEESGRSAKSVGQFLNATLESVSLTTLKLRLRSVRRLQAMMEFESERDRTQADLEHMKRVNQELDNQKGQHLESLDAKRREHEQTLSQLDAARHELDEAKAAAGRRDSELASPLRNLYRALRRVGGSPH